MTSETPTQTRSPWHRGEVTLQSAVGVADRMAIAGQKVIRDYMPDQHRDFYAQLPFIVAGAVDSAGDAWATLLTGAPGFASSPDPRTLAFAVARDAADPADAGLNDGDAIGLLGIELNSRRRNRMNGTVQRGASPGFSVQVEHAFGNCPQYIQLRDWQVTETLVGDRNARRGAGCCRAQGSSRCRRARHDHWRRYLLRRFLCR
jgi:predicted pyridoxine 5'-phosphate oxidase superfamily flavin-nucleotide-binding protein